MKTVFISDVHGNLEALDAVLDAIKGERTDRIVFLGDAVGYGANPNECIEKIESISIVAIAGNHDRVAAGMESENSFNEFAQTAIRWTRRILTPSSLRFLQGLQLQAVYDDFLLVHATPECPGAWDYIMYEDEACLNFSCFPHRICFCGHSHYPVIFVQRKPGDVVIERSVHIKVHPEYRYIINCGSVGQPRDGNPFACYGVYDNDIETYRIERIPYDIATAQQKILNAGLPGILARRLAAGR